MKAIILRLFWLIVFLLIAFAAIPIIVCVGADKYAKYMDSILPKIM